MSRRPRRPAVGDEQPRLPGFEPAAAISVLAQPVNAAAGRLELSDEQLQAVRRRSEPLLLSAAAGSGKTSVLVERFVRAVRDDGVAPGAILAITFTERAAGELRSRIRVRLLELGDRNAAQDAESAYLGTFHGFCARLLRAHPLAGNLDPGFTILDEGLAARLRERAFTEALRGMLVSEPPPAVDLAAAFSVDGLRAIVTGAFLELRSQGQLRPRLPPADPARYSGPLDAQAIQACLLIDDLLGRFADTYERHKTARAAVDFDDLELHAAELLHGREAIRRSYSERFELLMVDEFQDTNARQLSILEALDRGNLFTVGDELQSIYGFRHADVRLFRERRAALAEHGASLSLRNNYRSNAAVLGAVNAAFAERFDGFAPLASGRTEEGPPPTSPVVELLLTTTRGWEDGDPGLAQRIAAGMPDSQDWRQAEARMLAERVAGLVRAGDAAAGDIVVLLRSTGDLEVYERALQLRGLRTLATVGTFWNRQQITDVTAYLRALANPLDEEALYSALASPLGGCSRDGLATLAGAARARGGGLWETLLALSTDETAAAAAGLSPLDEEAAASFCELLRHERVRMPNRSLAALIEHALDASGYRRLVLGLDWGDRRLANLEKLIRQARSFEGREGRDLRAFLDHVEHLKKAGLVEREAPVDGVEQDAVRLMSVHAAKGLEFPVVCLADLGRKPNLVQGALLIDGERIGLRLASLEESSAEPTLEYEALKQERLEREAQEEDRVLYVAMTRARERLLLSGALDFESWPKAAPTSPPIGWLVEALAPALAGSLTTGDTSADGRTIAVGATQVLCHLNTPALAPAKLTLPASAKQLAVTAEPPPAPGTRDRPRGAPAPAGPAVARRELPETLSYSSLSDLERCGYRFYLERVLRLPETREGDRGGGELGARERGTVVHGLMEGLDFVHPRPMTAEAVVALAAELGIVVSEPAAAEMLALVRGALTSPLAGRIASAGQAHREHPFAFGLPGAQPLVVGVMDLLATEHDRTNLVLDYKTDRVAAGQNLDALVERDYGVQRLVYALAVLRAGAARVEVIHWFLERPADWVSSVYEASERSRLESELAALTELPFEVSRTPHKGLCLTCPGRRGLCSWGDSETLREDPADGEGMTSAPIPSA